MFEIKSQNKRQHVSLVSEVQVIPNCCCMSGSQKFEFFLLCCNNVGDLCHPENRVKRKKEKRKEKLFIHEQMQTFFCVLMWSVG